MKKQILILSSELLSLIVIGFLIGRFLDSWLEWKGWGTLACLVLVYFLWFLKFYKSLLKERED